MSSESNDHVWGAFNDALILRMTTMLGISTFRKSCSDSHLMADMRLGQVSKLSKCALEIAALECWHMTVLSPETLTSNTARDFSLKARGTKSSMGVHDLH